MSDKFIEALKSLSGAPNYVTGIVLDDKRIIGYRPKLNLITGSVIKTILLCQSMYWAKAKSNPFYKFREPCKHNLYRDGDSWCEELGISIREYRGAIDGICQQVGKSTLADPEAFMWRWTDISRVTWYMVNWNKVNEMIEACYNPEKDKTSFMKRTKRPAGKGQDDFLQKDNTSHSKEPKRPFVNIDTITTSINNQTVSSSEPLEADLWRYFKDFGIDDDEYEFYLGLISRYNQDLIREKVKDIIQKIYAGEIANVKAYVKKTFSQERLYTPIEEERILGRLEQQKKISESKAKIDSEVAREADRQAEFIERTDRLIAEMTDVQKIEFEKQILEHRILATFYKKSGIGSILVKAELRRWITEGTNEKAC